jgi:hypothetical protein
MVSDLESNYYYEESDGNVITVPLLIPEDLEDMETDEEESVVESSPYA